MARDPFTQELLDRYGVKPCNDNSCMFGSPGGMATNGGCRCRDGDRYELRQLTAKLALMLRDAVAAARSGTQERP